MFLTGQMSKVKSGLRAISERWRGRSNQQVIPAPVKRERLIKLPYTSTTEVKTVEFKATAALLEPIVFTHRECKSHEKMNNRRKHRQALKKFHKHQARCNKNYRVKA